MRWLRAIWLVEKVPPLTSASRVAENAHLSILYGNVGDGRITFRFRGRKLTGLFSFICLKGRQVRNGF